jgi:rhodanese-related sulfurtransferase
VALQLKKLGIVRVRPLEGGFDKWRELGYPMVDAVISFSTAVGS